MKHLMTILLSTLLLNGCATLSEGYGRASGFLAGNSSYGETVGWKKAGSKLIGVYPVDSEYCKRLTVLIPSDQFNRRSREYDACIVNRGYEAVPVAFNGTEYVAIEGAK